MIPKRRTRYYDYSEFEKELTPKEPHKWEIITAKRLYKLLDLDPLRVENLIKYPPNRRKKALAPFADQIRSLAYVDSTIRKSTSARVLEATLCLGNVAPYVDMLSEWEQDIIIPIDGKQDFMYCYQNYMPNQILIFERLVPVEALYDFPRQLILVNCQPQFIFPSVEGKPGDGMLHAMRFIANNYKIEPVRVKLDEDHPRYSDLRQLVFRDSFEYY